MVRGNVVMRRHRSPDQSAASENSDAGRVAGNWCNLRNFDSDAREGNHFYAIEFRPVGRWTFSHQVDLSPESKIPSARLEKEQPGISRIDSRRYHGPQLSRLASPPDSQCRRIIMQHRHPAGRQHCAVLTTSGNQKPSPPATRPASGSCRITVAADGR